MTGLHIPSIAEGHLELVVDSGENHYGGYGDVPWQAFSFSRQQLHMQRRTNSARSSATRSKNLKKELAGLRKGTSIIPKTEPKPKHEWSSRKHRTPYGPDISFKFDPFKEESPSTSPCFSPWSMIEANSTFTDLLVQHRPPGDDNTNSVAVYHPWSPDYEERDDYFSPLVREDIHPVIDKTQNNPATNGDELRHDRNRRGVRYTTTAFGDILAPVPRASVVVALAAFEEQASRLLSLVIDITKTFDEDVAKLSTISGGPPRWG